MGVRQMRATAIIIICASTISVALPASRPLPHEVARFLDRREQCDHWAGEEPYDADRRRQIERAIVKLRCDRIEAEESALRKRYTRDRAVRKALDQDSETASP